MKISISKSLVVVFAILSVSTSATSLNQTIAVHAADKVKVGGARLQNGFACHANSECFSSCCSQNKCSVVKACSKPKGFLTSLRDVSF
jgi:hypothetical protein